jgi:methyl-accepting chemotaxis protein
MSKIIYKVLFPILLASLFAIAIFIAIDYDQLRPESYIVLFLVVITIFFFGYATGERFASPLRNLIEKANNINTENLGQKIYIDTRDEMEELAEIYNKLAEKLKESLDKEKAAEGSIDIKVRAKTQSLEETISALEQKVQNRTIELEKNLKEIEALKMQLKAKDTELSEFKK